MRTQATWTVARTMFRFGDLKLKKLLQLTHSFETRLATPMDDAGEDGQILRDLTLDQVRCSLVQLMRHHIVTVKVRRALFYACLSKRAHCAVLT